MTLLPEGFVWPSDQARADSDELNRVCEALEEVIDALPPAPAEQDDVFPTLDRLDLALRFSLCRDGLAGMRADVKQAQSLLALARQEHDALVSLARRWADLKGVPIDLAHDYQKVMEVHGRKAEEAPDADG